MWWTLEESALSWLITALHCMRCVCEYVRCLFCFFFWKRERVCFAGKESLFKGPWAGFFRALGGFPVNRSAASGFVPQMAERFASEAKMRFVIAPEGTRSFAPHVRSSFYHVAVAARVPIVLGAFDFPNKRVVVNALFTPSGDVNADLAAIDGYYRRRGNQGAKPELAAPWKFRA